MSLAVPLLLSACHAAVSLRRLLLLCASYRHAIRSVFLPLFCFSIRSMLICCFSFSVLFVGSFVFFLAQVLCCVLFTLRSLSKEKRQQQAKAKQTTQQTTYREKPINVKSCRIFEAFCFFPSLQSFIHFN